MNRALIQTIGAIALWLLLLKTGASTAFASDKPLRIVSMNLCTDQFLLALAEREQILSVSPFATDKNSSYYAERAKGLPRIREGTESVIKLNPDILLATSFDSKNTIKFVRGRGIKVLILKYPNSLKEIGDQILSVGKTIGQMKKAQQLHDKFTGVVNKSKNLFSGKSLSVLHYQRGGYVSGRNTLIGILLDHVGLRNHAAYHGISFYGKFSLEKLIMSQPDVFLFSRFNQISEDQGNQLLEHPALRKIQKNKEVLNLPTSETVCPGPGTLAALHRLMQFYQRMK